MILDSHLDREVQLKFRLARSLFQGEENIVNCVMHMSGMPQIKYTSNKQKLRLFLDLNH